MTSIRITGWKFGFNKVKLGSLLRENCGLSLSEAKQYVDSILSGDAVVVAVSPDCTSSFVDRASELGAVCELVDN